MTGDPKPAPRSRRLLLDIAERATWTFLQAAAAVIVASQGFGVEVWKAAAVAGALAILKGVLASRVGNDRTAAALPGSLDELPPPPRRRA